VPQLEGEVEGSPTNGRPVAETLGQIRSQLVLRHQRIGEAMEYLEQDFAVKDCDMQSLRRAFESEVRHSEEQTLSEERASQTWHQVTSQLEAEVVVARLSMQVGGRLAEREVKDEIAQWRSCAVQHELNLGRCNEELAKAVAKHESTAARLTEEEMACRATCRAEALANRPLEGMCLHEADAAHPEATIRAPQRLRTTQPADVVVGRSWRSIQIMLEIAVSPEVGSMGLAFAVLPPAAAVVAHVGDGSWAEAEGVERGDELLEVGGQAVCEMSAEAFASAMLERPLLLRFWRSRKCGAHPCSLRVSPPTSPRSPEKESGAFMPPVGKKDLAAAAPALPAVEHDDEFFW